MDQDLVLEVILKKEAKIKRLKEEKAEKEATIKRLTRENGELVEKLKHFGQSNGRTSPASSYHQHSTLRESSPSQDPSHKDLAQALAEIQRLDEDIAAEEIRRLTQANSELTVNLLRAKVENSILTTTVTDQFERLEAEKAGKDQIIQILTKKNEELGRRIDEFEQWNGGEQELGRRTDECEHWTDWEEGIQVVDGKQNPVASHNAADLELIDALVEIQRYEADEAANEIQRLKQENEELAESLSIAQRVISERVLYCSGGMVAATWHDATHQELVNEIRRLEAEKLERDATIQMLSLENGELAKLLEACEQEKEEALKALSDQEFTMERVANANGSMQLKLQDSQEEIKKLEAEKAEKEATILKLTKEVEEMREKFTKIDLEKQQASPPPNPANDPYALLRYQLEAALEIGEKVQKGQATGITMEDFQQAVEEHRKKAENAGESSKTTVTGSNQPEEKNIDQENQLNRTTGVSGAPQRSATSQKLQSLLAEQAAIHQAQLALLTSMNGSSNTFSAWPLNLSSGGATVTGINQFGQQNINTVLSGFAEAPLPKQSNEQIVGENNLVFQNGVLVPIRQILQSRQNDMIPFETLNRVAAPPGFRPIAPPASRLPFTEVPSIPLPGNITVAHSNEELVGGGTQNDSLDTSSSIPAHPLPFPFIRYQNPILDQIHQRSQMAGYPDDGPIKEVGLWHPIPFPGNLMSNSKCSGFSAAPLSGNVTVTGQEQAMQCQQPNNLEKMGEKMRKGAAGPGFRSVAPVTPARISINPSSVFPVSGSKTSSSGSRDTTVAQANEIEVPPTEEAFQDGSAEIERLSIESESSEDSLVTLEMDKDETPSSSPDVIIDASQVPVRLPDYVVSEEEGTLRKCMGDRLMKAVEESRQRAERQVEADVLNFFTGLPFPPMVMNMGKVAEQRETATSIISSELKSIKSELEMNMFETMNTVLIMGGNMEAFDEMLVLNRDKSAWNKLILKLPHKIVGGGAIHLNGEIYIFGGYNMNKNLYKLDKSFEWNQLADMNQGRIDITNSSVMWRGQIFVFGGVNGVAGPLNTVERYDPGLNQWTNMPEMKHPRAEAAAAVCQDKIIVCGGWNLENSFLRSVECFDPESGVWSEMNDMIAPLSGHALVPYGDTLILMGGRYGENCINWVMELSNLEGKGQWRTLPSLNHESHLFTVVTLGKKIYVMGGWGPEGALNRVEIFDGHGWQEGPELPYTCTQMAVVVPNYFSNDLCIHQNKC